MIQVSETNLPGVLHISPDIFKDDRGQFVETYNEELYKQNGVTATFVQDDFSASKKDVLRGIHGDPDTFKLVSCLYGTLFFVVINCNEKSKDFGKWQTFTLSDKNRIQILIPPRYGNAYLVQSEYGIFAYKQSTYYDPKRQFTYMWNDPRFAIPWPIKNPILSERDTVGHYV